MGIRDVLGRVFGRRRTAEEADSTDKSAPAAAGSAPRIRSRLFTKYVGLFVLVVSVALISNGIFEVYFYHQEHKASLIRIQREQAEAASAKISQFIKEIESQLGWTTQLPWSASSIEQRRFDALRLLRQVPAITELAQVNSSGKERLRVSRLAMDVVGSGIDFSKEPKFTEAAANKIYYGPVYFRREVRALHDAGARRHAARRRREHRGGQPQADLGRGVADQGRRKRQRLRDRPAGTLDRASRHQPGVAQHRHVATCACARRRRCRVGRLRRTSAGGAERPGPRGADRVGADRAARLADVRRASGRGSLRVALRSVPPAGLCAACRAGVRHAGRDVPGAAHGGPDPGVAGGRGPDRQRRFRPAHLDQVRRRARRSRQPVQRHGRAARGILRRPGEQGRAAHQRAGAIGRRAARARRGVAGRQLDPRPRTGAVDHRDQRRPALQHRSWRHLCVRRTGAGVPAARHLWHER